MKGAGRFRSWLEQSVSQRYYGGEKPAEKDMLQHTIEATDRNGNPNEFGHVLSESGNGLYRNSRTKLMRSSWGRCGYRFNWHSRNDALSDETPGC